MLQTFDDVALLVIASGGENQNRRHGAIIHSPSKENRPLVRDGLGNGERSGRSERVAYDWCSTHPRYSNPSLYLGSYRYPSPSICVRWHSYCSPDLSTACNPFADSNPSLSHFRASWICRNVTLFPFRWFSLPVEE